MQAEQQPLRDIGGTGPHLPAFRLPFSSSASSRGSRPCCSSLPRRTARHALAQSRLISVSTTGCRSSCHASSAAQEPPDTCIIDRQQGQLPQHQVLLRSRLIPCVIDRQQGQLPRTSAWPSRCRAAARAWSCRTSAGGPAARRPRPLVSRGSRDSNTGVRNPLPYARSPHLALPSSGPACRTPCARASPPARPAPSWRAWPSASPPALRHPCRRSPPTPGASQPSPVQYSKLSAVWDGWLAPC